MSRIVLIFLLYLLDFTSASTECLWATGIIECRKNQTRVEGAVVEVFDLDSPEASSIVNPLDPDDKVGFSYVDNTQGLWNVEGCAADQDWLPGIPNRPEFYIRIFHKCNRPEGEFKRILPVFRVYTPETYDFHIQHPIVLDQDYDPKEDEKAFELDMGSV
ncbi:unnamed protein product [Bursaphelenchus xylophilus]|uniref:(pine wood nematode) hypothetical protein n=1 Tax=Bursaphelenchus xylophilus TaxID=6326 RepID=A0A1I7S3Q6_BURXY|nr:unnamed protein product [Bursaphelenchus xylophilus]CAG9116465.1 unnamed protein product [Bursaphelenchus xylophilus]